MAKYPYQKTCEHCGTNFTISQSYQKTQKFCSHICSQNSRTKHPRSESCLQCAGPLRSGQFKFCSQSCSATFSNTKRGAHSLERKIKIREGVYRKNNKTPDQPYDPEIRKCLNCNNLCRHRGLKYCSIKCSSTKIKTKTCIICGCEFQSRSSAKTCEAHKSRYNMKDRVPYEFRFNVYDFPNLFDLDMLTQIGFKNRSNKNGIVRDHKVSIYDARKYGYDPYYISHVLNCQLLRSNDNLSKSKRSDMLYETLVKLVDEYDSQHRPLTPAAEPAA